MKVKLVDRKLFKSFGGVVSWISTILSLILIFVSIPDDNSTKFKLAGIFILILIIIYLIMWLCANKQEKVSLRINGTKVEVKFGDLFAQTRCLKIIPVNEYFDTIVDDRIISSTSIHGQYIKKHANTTPDKLRKLIDTDKSLQENIAYIENRRKEGPQVAYKLGSIFKHNNYLLVAFTKFDLNNRAYLNNKLLWESLMNMWQNVDIYHSGKSICLPLLGSGMARLYNMNLSEQQLLELLIVSLRLSGVKFNWNVKVSIIIYPGNKDMINLYNLESLSD